MQFSISINSKSNLKKKNTFLMKKMSYVGKITKFQIVERKYQTLSGLTKFPFLDSTTPPMPSS